MTSDLFTGSGTNFVTGLFDKVKDTGQMALDVLNEMMSNAASTLASPFESMGNSIEEQMNTSFGQINVLTEAFRKAFKEAGEAAGGESEKAAKKRVSDLAKAIKAMKALVMDRVNFQIEAGQAELEDRRRILREWLANVSIGTKEEIDLKKKLAAVNDEIATREIKNYEEQEISIEEKIVLLKKLAVSFEKMGDTGGKALKKTREEIAKLNKQLEGKTFSAGAKKAAEEYFKSVQDDSKKAATFVGTSMNTLEDSLTEFFSTGKFAFSDFFDAIKVGLARLAAQDVIGSIGSALGFGQGGGSGGGGFLTGLFSGLGSAVSGFFGDIFSFASGGLVRGRGSGTSDSNVVRVSAGEYIVNSQASRRFRPLLDVINSSGAQMGGAPKRRGRDGLLQFSSGGSYGGEDFGGLGGSGGSGLSGGAEPYGGTDHGGEDYVPPTGGHGAEDFTGPGGAAGSGLPGGAAGFGDNGYTPEGLYNIYDAMGRVIDRVGGTLRERIGTFFGEGIHDGFTGSRGAGALISIISSLLGGIPGMIAGLVGNLARESSTSGRAKGSGIAGLIYDLGSGAQTMPGLWDAFLGGVTRGIGGGTSPGAAGSPTGGGGAGDGGDNFAPPGIGAGGGGGAGGSALSGIGKVNLAGRLTTAWDKVLGTSGQVLASANSFGTGGSFIASRPSLIGVGEHGMERVTVEPSTGTPFNRGSGITLVIEGDLIADEIGVSRLTSRIAAEINNSRTV